jgi:hypothetical protein
MDESDSVLEQREAREEAADDPQEEPAPEPNGEAASGDVAVGEAATTEGGNEIIVYSYVSVPPTDMWQPEPGSELIGFNFQGCASPDADPDSVVSYNSYDFQLQMPDGTRITKVVWAKEFAFNYAYELFV